MRPLNDREKSLLAPYIPQVDLDNADIHENEMPSYAPDKANALAQGNDIYFREKYNPCTPRSISLLGHELVHVGQWREGMTILSYFIWSEDYEDAAYATGNKIMQDLKKNNPHCGCLDNDLSK